MQSQSSPSLPLADLSAPSYVVRWFWQSDFDPWKDTDPTKWTWTAYSHDLNFTIENGFESDPISLVDIGHYEVDLKNMVQYKKGDKYRMRRVRREIQEQSRMTLELSAPQAQRTFNKAFGTVEHFISYIMSRTPESNRILRRLEGLRLESKQADYQDVLDEIVNSLRKAEEARNEHLKAKFNGKPPFYTVYTLKAQHLADYFAQSSATLRDLLIAVLKAYTMHSFLYSWLNELLRNEDWTGINVLTPYLVCFAYTFRCPEYVMKYDPTKSTKSLFGLIKTKTLKVYRGAALLKEHLDQYDPKKTPYFSWNGITSTSRNRKEAIKFAGATPDKKIGVLFTMEIDFSSQKDCEGMIDVAPYSDFEREEEIILAPATVFKIIEHKVGKDERHYVELKVMKNFDDNIKDNNRNSDSSIKTANIPLVGTLQERIIQKDAGVLHSLTPDEMVRALDILKDNKFITKLDIADCIIDRKLMQLIESVRATTNIPKNQVTITRSQVHTSSFNRICYYYSDEGLDRICEHNRVWFGEKEAEDVLEEASYKIKKLYLRSKALNALYKHGQTEEIFNLIRNQKELREVNIEIDDMLDTTESPLESILNAMKKTNCIEKLSISLKKYKRSIQEIKTALKQIKGLHALAFDFTECGEMNDDELKGIADGLPQSLQHLSLNLRECFEVSDKGISSITDALKFCTSLQHLSLDLNGHEKICDNSISSIADIIKLTPSLRHLSIHVSKCDKVSDEGIGSITDALRLTPGLQHLSLDLSCCKKVSDESINNIADVLKSIPSLEHLSLDLDSCEKVSDKGISSIADTLRLLPSLQHVSLCLYGCYKVSKQMKSAIRADSKLASLKSFSIY